MNVHPFGTRGTIEAPASTRPDRIAVAAKRGFDILVAATALLAFSPVMLVVALLCAARLGRPVLYRQPRPGRGGRPITITKFRSMRDGTDAAGRALPDAERLTPFGAFLRRTSLDEIPQLWSVLKGDLSLVGPRPLLMEYLPLYTPFQMRRHEVRPGITGWAQVNGRNGIGWDRKFELDVWYVDNWSLRLDLRILLMTLAKVARGDGVSAQGATTMPVFTGSIRHEPDPAALPVVAGEREMRTPDQTMVSGHPRW